MSGQITVHRLEYNGFTRAIDAVAKAALKISPRLGRLDVPEILAAAQRSAGLTDWGPEDFIEAMRKIIEAVPTDRMTPMAKIAARGVLFKAVKNRLQILDYLKRHGNIRKIPIQRPIFVLGFPRSGTTLLQNLLSQDPERRALEFWELISPVPVHDIPEIDMTRRRRQAEWMLKVSYLSAPEQALVHHIQATTAEECWPLFQNNCTVLNMDLQTCARGYGDWLMGLDMRPAYRFYRAQIQLLLHRRPTRQLILKCPEHLWFLDALLEVFPDAAIIWTHRDPYDSVASYCSLISLAYRHHYGRIDPTEIGSHVAYRLHTGVEAAMAARDRMQHDNIFDVNFEDLVRDPGAVLRSISDHFDLDWSINPDDAVTRYQEAARQDKVGKHRYDGAFYGLDAEEIYAKFSAYSARFGVNRQEQQRAAR